FTLGDHPALLAGLRAYAAVESGRCEIRRFPDDESYVRVLDDCRGRRTAILCSLNQPDDRILQLVFLAATLRELGAQSVGLIAPYLAYMRQDKRFHEGEAITSRLFAAQLSAQFDWLITVDPHLHRYRSLSEIYSIPHRLVHAAPLLSTWIQQHVERPLLIGPDSESAQWVEAVAHSAQAPFIVLDKIRSGDRDVMVSTPDVTRWSTHTPILVDDIISTGHTMLQTIAHLCGVGLPAPICIGVHGLFAEQADARLIAAGAARIVTTNSVPHASNAIDLSAALMAALVDLEPG